MKKYLLIIFNIISFSLFSQQGVIDSNFGLGEYNYVDNEYKVVPTSIDYVDNTLYVAGYSSAKTDISSEGYGIGIGFQYKDAFYYHARNKNGLFIEKAVSIGNNGSRANAIKYYNGEVVLAGYSIDDNNKSIALVRLNAENGAIGNEYEFSNDGKVITDFTSDDVANTIDIKNEKIFIGGKAGNKAVVVKYFFNNGRVDKDFNQKGFVFLELGQKSEIKSLEVLSNDKILVSGYTYDGIQEDFFVARLNSDGTLDIGFGNNGIKIIDFYGKNDRLNTMKVLSDGKILLAGFCTTNTTTKIDAAVVKLDNNGNLDASFNATGKKVINFGTQEDVINYIDTNALEEIVILGYNKPGNYKNSVLNSYDKNGGNTFTDQTYVTNQSYYDDYLVAGYFEPNSTPYYGISPIGVGFCRDKKAYMLWGNFDSLIFTSSCGLDIASETENRITKILSQDDGKFYVLNSGRLFRYLPSGLIDKTFADNGQFKEFLVGDFDVLSDKKIAAKSVYNTGYINLNYNMIIDETGKIDDNFQFQNFENSTSNQGVNCFLFNKTNEKLYALGYADFTNDNELTKAILYRYNSDGTIDNTFAENKGYIGISSQYGMYGANQNAVFIGKNSIASTFIDSSNKKLSIYLYDLDGSPITSFGVNGMFQKDYSPAYDEHFEKIIVDSFNNVYLISHISTDFNYRILVEKISSNGTIDYSYGNNGVFTFNDMKSAGYNHIYNQKVSAKIQNDGKLLIGGFGIDENLDTNGFIFRINNNGSIDNTFGMKNNGIVSDFRDNNPNDYFEEINAIELTSDNKILVGGLNREGIVGTGTTNNNKIKRFQ